MASDDNQCSIKLLILMDRHAAECSTKLVMLVCVTDVVSLLSTAYGMHACVSSLTQVQCSGQILWFGGRGHAESVKQLPASC
jgi:hypothetical protein